jgi:lysophospholipase L1-like esterase
VRHLVDVLRRRWRRVLLGVVAVPVLLVLLLLAEAQYAARTGQDLPDEPADLDGTVGAREPGPVLRTTWLGDSTAAGLGASDADHAVARQVAARLAADLHRPVEVTGLATSGDRVGDVLDDQVGRVPRDSQLVLISVGANDATHLTGRDDLRSRYGEVLDRLAARLAPGTPIVLLGVPDLGAVTRLPQPLRAVAGWRGEQLDEDVRHLAGARHLGYVDIAGETGPAFRRDPTHLLAADRYHPNDRGYGLWTDAIVPVAEEVLRAHP